MPAEPEARGWIAAQQIWASTHATLPRELSTAIPHPRTHTIGATPAPAPAFGGRLPDSEFETGVAMLCRLSSDWVPLTDTLQLQRFESYFFTLRR
eukprot:7382410-Prymnesium_polylepis.2